jgi:hypothetical protein
MTRERAERPLPRVRLLILVALLPFLLGQNECQINQDLINQLNNLLTDKFQPQPGQQRVYITQLSFVDALTHSMYMQTEESALINEAVVDGIQRAAQANPNFVFNEDGHKLENTQANVNRFIEVFMDMNRTPKENMQQLVREMLEPNGVDVVVTGTFVDIAKQDAVRITPMVVARTEEKGVSRQHEFSKREYICRDPHSSSTKILCANAHEEIAKTVKELLGAL